jgi:hypothetical protein
MLGLGILALIGVGLVKVPHATVKGLNYIANHAISWITQLWIYLGGLK